MKLTIEVFNTYYRVSSHDLGSLKDALAPLLFSLRSYKFEFNRKIRRMVRVLDKEFFTFDVRMKSYILPISTLAQCVADLRVKGIVVDKYNVTFKTDIPIHHLNVELNPDFQPRDYQKLYIDAIVNPSSPKYTLIDLKPGAGKTFISMFAVSKINYRVGIVILPKYIEKWIDDIKKYTTIDPKRVYIVRGMSSIAELINSKMDYDFIIFSMRTLYNFNKAYEDGDIFPIRPWELFNKLQIGTLLSDESHQELGALSKIIMYSNVKKVIGLSATYLSNNKDEARLQEVVFPKSTRISQLVKFDTYIDVYAVRYDVASYVRLKDGGGQGYNHMQYEISMMKHPDLFTNYLNMVDYYVNEGYITEKKEGDKCLVFFATIDACTRAASYFAKKYPNLKIERYIGEDDFQTMINGDIIISNIMMSGTAIDFPNLICVVNTVSIGSAKSNIQVTGRLRKIEGRETRYYYLYSQRNRSQTKLHRQRMYSIGHMAKTYRHLDYPVKLVDVNGGNLFD